MILCVSVDSVVGILPCIPGEYCHKTEAGTNPFDSLHLSKTWVTQAQRGTSGDGSVPVHPKVTAA